MPLARLQQHAQDMKSPASFRWTVRRSDHGTILLIMRDESGQALTWAELNSVEAWQMARHLNDAADEI